MTNVDDAEQTLTTAQGALALAAAETARAERIAELLAQPGLTYGHLGDGTHYVAYDGEHLGYCRRSGEGSSPLLNWFAYPINESPTTGPYLTARQAAAALMHQRPNTWTTSYRNAGPQASQVGSVDN